VAALHNGLHGIAWLFFLSYALEWVWRLVLMKADGKSAKGGSDQGDKEDFGEASGRSNGGLRKKIREPF